MRRKGRSVMLGFVSSAGPAATRPTLRLALTAGFVEAGLDLIQWFAVDHVNRQLPREAQLPTTGSHGVLLGNTRALWGPFQTWLAQNSRKRDPLDAYVEEVVVEQLSPVAPSFVGFAHHMEPKPLPIQRIAAATGLARVGPMGLCIHPKYGPWIALRAVALFDDASVQPSAVSGAHPCEHCAGPCRPLFEHALNETTGGTRRFLPVRDSCPVGRKYRYEIAQINHHYGTSTGS